MDALHIKEYLRPLVILSEAKKDFYIGPSNLEPHLHRVAAQPAVSARPILTIMIMAAIQDYQQQIERTEGSTRPVCIPSVPGQLFPPYSYAASVLHSGS